MATAACLKLYGKLHDDAGNNTQNVYTISWQQLHDKAVWQYPQFSISRIARNVKVQGSFYFVPTYACEFCGIITPNN